MPSINNLLQGFQDGLPGMKDYQHASRLYLDDNYKLMPKQKFLFHVVFNTDESLFQTAFAQNERYELNMLVKSCDLPRYNMSMEEKTQYNKKMYTTTRKKMNISEEREIRELIQKAFDDLPRIPLWQPTLESAMSPKLEGYTFWYHRQIDARSLKI